MIFGFFAALAILFTLACLILWWARGGAIPAIMLTLLLLPCVAVVGVSAHDSPGVENLVYAPLVLLALLAVAWTPRWLLRRALAQIARGEFAAPAPWSRHFSPPTFIPTPFEPSVRRILAARIGPCVGAACGVAALAMIFAG